MEVSGGGHCWVAFVERTAYMQTYYKDVDCVNIPGERGGNGESNKGKKRAEQKFSIAYSSFSASLQEILCLST